MPSPAVEATCDGAVAVPLAGKPCGKAGSMSRLCSKAFILPLDFLSTKLVINSQGSWWVFHERLRPLQMLAMVVNLLGFALVGAVSALLAGTDGNVSGLLLGLFSGICFALY